MAPPFIIALERWIALYEHKWKYISKWRFILTLASIYITAMSIYLLESWGRSSSLSMRYEILFLVFFLILMTIIVIYITFLFFRYDINSKKLSIPFTYKGGIISGENPYQNYTLLVSNIERQLQENMIRYTKTTEGIPNKPYLTQLKLEPRDLSIYIIGTGGRLGTVTINIVVRKMTPENEAYFESTLKAIIEKAAFGEEEPYPYEWPIRV